MSEIKSTFSKEQIEQYSRENNLDVLSLSQISAKFMDLESRMEKVEYKYLRLSPDIYNELQIFEQSL